MKNHDKKRRAILGISGASGSIYALRLAKFLLEAGAQVYCIPSRPAKKILSDETGFDSFETAIEAQLEKKALLGNLKMCDIDDFYAPPASGSFGFEAMCILPCSMNTLGKIAGSIADNLLVRAAEVALKERRKLVVCPRESPLALSHIENMKTLFLSGAVVLPACPAFYNKPKSITDIADFTASRAAAAMGFGGGNLAEWGI